MVNVAVWSAAPGHAPRRLQLGSPDLEQDLELWVQQDPSLVRDGLLVVARQLVFSGQERLDLLCVENRSRWLVVELKRNRLPREVASQALDYVSLLAQMSASELRARLKPHLSQTPAEVQQLVASLLAQEDADNPREVAAVVVGIAADESLLRITRYLSEPPHEVPIAVVELQAFRTPSGDLLIVREETGDDVGAPGGEDGAVRPSASFDQRWARVVTSAGPTFAGALHELHECFLGSPIYLRPYTRSIMIAPAANRSRYLAVVSFGIGSAGQDAAHISYGVDAIVEFFPALTPDQVRTTLGEETAVFNREQLVAWGMRFATLFNQ